MKQLKFLLLPLLGLILGTASLSAQQPYACVTKGTVQEYANYNERGKVTSYTRKAVIDVSDMGGGNYTVRVENSLVKKPGKKKTGKDPYITISEIRGGSVNASPVMAEGVAEVVEGAEVVMLPNKLAVGYQLPIGDIRLSLGGMNQVATINENDIIGREEVTTPAGTFKCYILSQSVTTSLLGVGMTTVTKSWYARGVGIVKTQTTTGGRLLSQTELVTCKQMKLK